MLAKGLNELKNVLNIYLMPEDLWINLKILAILRDLITVAEVPIFKVENY